MTIRFACASETIMGAPDYLLVQSELTAVHSKLDSVARDLSLWDQTAARSSILLAMDSILLAEDQLRQLPQNRCRLVAHKGERHRRSRLHRS